MKIIYKGKLKNIDDLSKGKLPDDAVKFKEADTSLEMLIPGMSYGLIIFIVLIVIITSILRINGIDGGDTFEFSFIAIVLVLLTLIPHEMLHAICYGNGTVVEIYNYLTHGGFITYTNTPISKRRFIFMSFLPNIVFGFIPFLIWAIFFKEAAFSNILLSFSTISIVTGIGDYINIKNALIQMPKGTMQQLSGFNSYWYYKEN